MKLTVLNIYVRNLKWKVVKGYHFQYRILNQNYHELILTFTAQISLTLWEVLQEVISYDLFPILHEVLYLVLLRVFVRYFKHYVAVCRPSHKPSTFPTLLLHWPSPVRYVQYLPVNNFISADYHSWHLTLYSLFIMIVHNYLGKWIPVDRHSHQCAGVNILYSVQKYKEGISLFHTVVVYIRQ